MKKIILFLLLLGILIASAVAALRFLATTEKGLQYLATAAVELSSGKLHIGSVSGVLARELELRSLSYSEGSGEIFIKTVTLKWDLSSIWNRRITIQSLLADGVMFSSAEGNSDPGQDSESDTMTQIFLPVDVSLNSAVITGLSITAAGQEPLSIKRIDLEGSVGGRRLSWVAKVHVQDSGSSLFSTGYPGSVDVRAGVNGVLDSGVVRIDINLQNASGQFAGHSFIAEGQGSTTAGFSSVRGHGEKRRG